ncbi:alanine racemase [Numidum massiliense]|uniref:alanine racemase n=1 Tax=Numidum massiliense TaxID=1522315 RepID=UPI0006D5A825|nr:alanine racemase [Numidum massiliense]
MTQRYYRETVVEIDLDAIGHNVQAFRAWLPRETNIMAVVKANAYGHGAPPVAREALASGASYLAVATLDEAIELQEAGIDAPILVLGYVPAYGLPEAIRRCVRLTVYRPDQLQQVMAAARALGQTALLHLKVDTGMGRLGIQLSEVEPLLRPTINSREVTWEGIFTHFACADARDKTATDQQADLFSQFVAKCRALGVTFPFVHCANSATAIDMPQYGYNMARIGVSLYGLYPSDEVEKQHVALKPALTLKTKIVHVKRVPPGTALSYGATYRTKTDVTIATLPIGYADGLNRLLSNRGCALVGGRRVPIVGRICMDQTLLAVPDGLTVANGDEVVLYGRQGDEQICVDEVAKLLGTINYEVTCAIGHRVPRIYVGSKKARCVD